MMNVISKTRAHSGPCPDTRVCYEDGSKILRKIANSRAVARKYGDRTGLCTGQERGGEPQKYFTI
jgi:hypothetical protein